MYQPTDNVTHEADIRAVIPDTFESQEAKILDHLDPLCMAWIKNRSFSRWPQSTKTVASMCPPKSDPAGFVRVLDDKTLAIPDRPGNHRYDGFLNILSTGRIGLVFFSRTATKSCT